MHGIGTVMCQRIPAQRQRLQREPERRCADLAEEDRDNNGQQKGDQWQGHRDLSSQPAPPRHSAASRLASIR